MTYIEFRNVCKRAGYDAQDKDSYHGYSDNFDVNRVYHDAPRGRFFL